MARHAVSARVSSDKNDRSGPRRRKYYKRKSTTAPKTKEEKVAEKEHEAAMRKKYLKSETFRKRQSVFQMNKVAKAEIETYHQSEIEGESDSSDSSLSGKDMDGTLVPIKEYPPEKLPLAVHFGSPSQSSYTLKFDIPELQCITDPIFENPSDSRNESGNLPENNVWRAPTIKNTKHLTNRKQHHFTEKEKLLKKRSAIERDDVKDALYCTDASQTVTKTSRVKHIIPDIAIQKAKKYHLLHIRHKLQTGHDLEERLKLAGDGVVRKFNWLWMKEPIDILLEKIFRDARAPKYTGFLKHAIFANPRDFVHCTKDTPELKSWAAYPDSTLYYCKHLHNNSRLKEVVLDLTRVNGQEDNHVMEYTEKIIQEATNLAFIGFVSIGTDKKGTLISFVVKSFIVFKPAKNKDGHICITA